MSAVTSKGQVTIPKRLRDYLGLKPGSEVTFELDDDGRVVLKTAVKRPVSPFAKWVGSQKGGLTTDEIMEMTRGKPEDDYPEGKGP